VKRILLLILCLATVALMVTQAKLHAQDAKRPPLIPSLDDHDR